MCDAVLERAEAGENEEQSWLVENGFVLCKDGILSANFPVFRSDVFAEVCALLAPISETAAVCMLEISDEAERVLKEHVPSTVKSKCRGYCQDSSPLGRGGISDGNVDC